LCTELGGFPPGSFYTTLVPKATPVQEAALALLIAAGLVGGAFTNPGFITKQYSLDDIVIHSLPDDQWIRELQYWESAYWATQQIVVTDHAIGPIMRAPRAERVVEAPSGADIQLCSMQKMRKQGGFR
jgi:hypothetical protein